MGAAAALLAVGAFVALRQMKPPSFSYDRFFASTEELIAWAWLYALHARSSIARVKPWQAEYTISAMRDQVLALACLRHGLPAREGRGMDGLPADVATPLQEALVRHLDPEELNRAFRAATSGLVREIRGVDQELAARLEPVLRDLTESLAGAPRP